MYSKFTPKIESVVIPPTRIISASSSYPASQVEFCGLHYAAKPPPHTHSTHSHALLYTHTLTHYDQLAVQKQLRLGLLGAALEGL